MNCVHVGVFSLLVEDRKMAERLERGRATEALNLQERRHVFLPEPLVEVRGGGL